MNLRREDHQVMEAQENKDFLLTTLMRTLILPKPYKSASELPMGQGTF